MMDLCGKIDIGFWTLTNFCKRLHHRGSIGLLGKLSFCYRKIHMVGALSTHGNDSRKTAEVWLDLTWLPGSIDKGGEEELGLPQMYSSSIRSSNLNLLMLAYAEETLILYLGLAFPIKCQIKFVKSSIILASPFLVWVLFNISSMLINQFVPPTFCLCFAFSVNFRGMLHHVCDVAYDEMFGPIRTQCRSTNWFMLILELARQDCETDFV